MNNINAIIVEDEKSNQVVLQNYLKKYCPEVTILETSGSYNQAIEDINRLQPNLLFLDIQLDHNYTAFDLLEQLNSLDFYIIFITAFDEYAQRAINDVDAAYYITKPLKISELEKAVQKVAKEIDAGVPPKQDIEILHQVKSMVNPLRKILVPVNSSFQFLDLDNIIRFQALGNYVQVYTMDKKRYIVYQKISFYEKKLLEQGFLRTHRSHLINLSQIDQFMKAGRGGTIVMKDESRVQLAPSYLKKFMEQF